MKKTTLIWLISLTLLIVTEIGSLFFINPIRDFKVEEFSYQTQENGYIVQINTLTGQVTISEIGKPVVKQPLPPAVSSMLDIIPYVYIIVILLGPVAWLAGNS